MISRVAQLSTRNVRYLEAGTGRPCVLLHAFPLSADQWLPQLHRVPPGWRFVAPDLRGFRGAGPAFEPVGLDGLSIDDYARDVLELMAHLEIEHAAVVGLSMGGYVAFGLLREAPRRVSALVLANTRATADTADGRAARETMLELLSREGTAGVATAMLPKMLGETTRRSQPDLVDVVDRLIRANPPEAVRAAVVAMRDRPDSTSMLRSVTCPALVLGGGEDVLIPPAALTALRDALPDGELEIRPNVGHLSNLEDPAAFSDALDRFLVR